MEQITVSNTETVVVGDISSPITIVTGLLGPKGKDGQSYTSISTMTDVDLANVKDGSLLIYSTNVNKWQAGNTLNNQILEAGQF